MDVTKKNFAFCTKNSIPLYYVSASNGTNVVKVGCSRRQIWLNTEQNGQKLYCCFQMFQDAIEKAAEYKKNPVDIEDQILEELENM